MESTTINGHLTTSVTVSMRQRSERNVLRGLVQRPLEAWPQASVLRAADFQHYSSAFQAISYMITSYLNDNRRPVLSQEVLADSEVGLGPLAGDLFELAHETTFTEGLQAVLNRPLTNGELTRIGKVANRCERIAESEVGIADGIQWEPFSAWSLTGSTVILDEPVIDGLLRRGETGNIIASTKIGKSWLALGLAFAVATGRNWLGRETLKGRVLLVDNELRQNTLKHRMQAVSTAMGLNACDTYSLFEAVNLRGEFNDLAEIESALNRYEAGDIDLILFDAKYRLFGPNQDENSNGDQAQFHNCIDRLATRLNAAILMVHHATKGGQSGRGVTDIGAGGGSQSRAVDCHLVIRPHAEEGLSVLDAAVRSFPPVEPQTIEFNFPLWRAAMSVEPILKCEKSRSDSKQDSKDRQSLSMLSDIFHEAKGKPLTRYDLHKQFGGGKDRINRLIRLGLDEGRFVPSGTKPGRNGEPAELFMLASLIQPEDEPEDDDTEQNANGLF